MSNYSKKVLEVLYKNISILASNKDLMNIIRSKSSDFSRNRKLPFHDVVKMILFIAAKPIKEELWDYFDYDLEVASSSAFVQARDKLLPDAFEKLFHMMNRDFPCESTYNGYHLIAVDGCDLATPLNTSDSTATVEQNGKFTSIYHIDSAYDILNNRYIDMLIDGTRHTNEQASMVTMAERYSQGKAIFIADRAYAAWNIMEHINQSNQSFLIRSKDIHSQSSILKKFNLPDSEFDMDFEITLTNKQNKEIKAHPEKYRFISTSSNFDYMKSGQNFYTIGFRAVRFKIDGKEKYQSILTNLPRDTFPPDIIKELYAFRWDIEVSFRHLKYSTGLKLLHTKKRNNIFQEIWARAILYNLSLIITRKIVQKPNKKKKWNYTINITRAIHLIRNMAKRKGGAPPNLEEIIAKELLPIRLKRQYPRKVKTQRLINFNYRFS